MQFFKPRLPVRGQDVAAVTTGRVLSRRRTPAQFSPGSRAVAPSLPSCKDRTAALSAPQPLPAAACIALQRGVSNRYCMSVSINRLINHPSSSPGRGQELVIVFIHPFQPEPSFQRTVFPTLKSKSSGLYLGLLSTILGRAQYSRCAG